MSQAAPPSNWSKSLDTGAFPVSLEITPPRRSHAELLERRARSLPSAAAIHVIQRPDREPSLVASEYLLGAGIEPIWHLVNRGRSRAEIEAEIDRGARIRPAGVLCMRGDHTASDAADTPLLRDAVAMLRARIPQIRIGATFNQYGPRERGLANLWPKLEAGADFVMTQPAFAPEALQEALAPVLESAPHVRIVPQVMPLPSLAILTRVEKRLRVPIPESARRALATGGEDAGWMLFESQVRQLRGWASGCAVTTPAMDLDRHTAHQIRLALGRP